MAPRSKKRNAAADNSCQLQGVSLLEDLPQAAAALIYQCLDARSRTALASVSRWARDLALSEARSVELQVHNNYAPRKPLARLLNRVCSAATAGRLTLTLGAHGFVSHSSDPVLSDLLAPAEQQGGWASVKELTLKDFPAGSRPLAKLVACAFPRIQLLVLQYMSLTGADLSSLSSCNQLSSIKLLFCWVPMTSTTPSLHALQNLRSLSLHQTDSRIAAGLTQLTGLSLRCGWEAFNQSLRQVCGLTQLQHLELSSGGHSLSADEVRSILTSLQQLTSLDLESTIHQPEFDVLLTHGTQLTSLTCTGLYLSEDRSASSCSWKELVMNNQGFDAATFAYMPTASLTRLGVWGGPSPPTTLHFTTTGMPEAVELPELMRRSLTNLMRCPAWQQCTSRVEISLVSDKDNDDIAVLSQLAALAPLSSKEVSVYIDILLGFMTAAGVQQLGDALGSSLKQLVLGRCILSDDFWPAIGSQLPGLQQLGVRRGVSGATAHELANFCSCATRPLQLSLTQELYNELRCLREVRAEGQIEGQSREGEVPLVTITAGDT